MKESSICNPSIYLKEAATYDKHPDNMRDAFWKLKTIMKDVLPATIEDVEKCVGLKRVKLQTGHVHWLCETHALKKPKNAEGFKAKLKINTHANHNY